ncbi:MAG: hypothetical protein ACM3PX_09610 [Omnitrophica WOR_2 bacterium]|jgi:hypothetical protein
MGNDYPRMITGKGFKGYIFDKEHFVLISIENQSERYTPCNDDILLAEEILNEKIEIVNNPQLNQGDHCPIIHKNLKKYIRQYVGFINKNGEKVIWINFLWNDKGMQDEVSKDIINVLDGCSYYWQIEINLTKKELYNLCINGSG